MSTKIYNAFVIRRMTLEELYPELISFRGQIQRAVFKKMTNLAARIAAEMIDHSIIIGKPIKGAIPLAWTEIKNRQREIEKSTERDPEVDFSFTICFIPYKGDIFGIPFTEQKDFLKLWRKRKFIDDYEYYNNTDRPRGVSEKEWDDRAKTWDAIFAKTSIPSELGFTFDLDVSYVPYPKPEDIIKYIPLYHDRLKTMSYGILSDEYVNRKKDANVERDCYMLLFDFLNWIKQPEGQAARALKMHELEAILPVGFSRESLTGS